MRELMDEQYRDITSALNKVGFTLKHSEGIGWPTPAELAAAGRAVYEASFPYAVEEALEEPSDKEKCALGVEILKTGPDTALECFCSARFSRLTAKLPDPAVEAAYQKMRMQDGWPHSKSEDSKRLRAKAQEIVAAVDEARKNKN